MDCECRCLQSLDDGSLFVTEDLSVGEAVSEYVSTSQYSWEQENCQRRCQQRSGSENRSVTSLCAVIIGAQCPCESKYF